MLELTDKQKELIHDLLSFTMMELDEWAFPRYHEAWNMMTDVETNDVLDWDWAIGMLVQILEDVYR
jgi:hypothetical protein